MEGQRSWCEIYNVILNILLRSKFLLTSVSVKEIRKQMLASYFVHNYIFRVGLNLCPPWYCTTNI